MNQQPSNTVLGDTMAPVFFRLPGRVGLAFNAISMFKDILTDYDGKAGRDLTQFETGCYNTALDTLRMYIGGEQLYDDENVPRPPEPQETADAPVNPPPAVVTPAVPAAFKVRNAFAPVKTKTTSPTPPPSSLPNDNH